MSFKSRQRLKLVPGLFVNLNRGLSLISIVGKRCSTHLSKRGVRSTASILKKGLSCSTETEKYADQVANSVSSPTTSSPAQTPSALPGSNSSQVKLIWMCAIAILCGISGFWLISPRPSNQAESDRAILAETFPTMTPEEGTNQSAPVPEVRRAALVISPQVRRAELVKPLTKKNHQESKEDTVASTPRVAVQPLERSTPPSTQYESLKCRLDLSMAPRMLRSVPCEKDKLCAPGCPNH